MLHRQYFKNTVIPVQFVHMITPMCSTINSNSNTEYNRLAYYISTFRDNNTYKILEILKHLLFAGRHFATLALDAIEVHLLVWCVASGVESEVLTDRVCPIFLYSGVNWILTRVLTQILTRVLIGVLTPVQLRI